MKGDVIIIEQHHRCVAHIIVNTINKEIQSKNGRYTISVAGESGSGKTEIGNALKIESKKRGIDSIVIGQDDYFFLPPKLNDAQRRNDSEWLGPHVEVNLEQLNQNLFDAIKNKDEIVKPLISYDKDLIEEEIINLRGIKVVIVEGTYTSLLKNIDKRIFIDKNRLDTMAHRQKRGRGKEFGDLFIENVLKIEHKIIAGHKHLADIVVNKDNSIIVNQNEVIDDCKE